MADDRPVNALKVKTALTLAAGDYVIGHDAGAPAAYRSTLGDLATWLNTEYPPATNFTDLGDTPADYAGAGGYAVMVNSSGTGLEFVQLNFASPAQGNLADSAIQPGDDAALLGSDANLPFLFLRSDNSGGTSWEPVPAGSFRGLTDTPSNYTGQAGKVPAVNSSETGLEFITAGGGGGDAIETNVQTGAAYTLVLEDAGKLVAVDRPSAAVVNIPTNASVTYDADTLISVGRDGAGEVTVKAPVGVLLNGVNGGSEKLAARWTTGTLHRRGNDIWTFTSVAAPDDAGFEPGDILLRPELRATTETVKALGSSGSAKTINLTDANVFTLTLNANCTLSLTGVPAGGAGKNFTLVITHSGANREITWPSAVRWAGGDAPALSGVDAEIDVLTFITPNAGTTWLGFVGGIGFS